jgi:hypothetical protein
MDLARWDMRKGHYQRNGKNPRSHEAGNNSGNALTGTGFVPRQKLTEVGWRNYREWYWRYNGDLWRLEQGEKERRR